MTLSVLPDHLECGWQIRLAVFAALGALTKKSGGVVTRDQMSAGSEFAGERIPLANEQVVLWRPKQLSAPRPQLVLPREDVLRPEQQLLRDLANGSTQFRHLPDRFCLEIVRIGPA